MHSNFLTRMAVGLASCVLVVSLTACTAPEGFENATEPVAASQAFKAKSIWFDGADPSKNGNILTALVFDGEGNVTPYDTRGLTYGDLKDLSDDEVIGLIERMDKENFEKDMDKRLDQIDKSIAFRESDPDSAEMAIPYLQERRKETEAFEYQKPKPVPYKLKIWTDDTGNSTASEALIYEAPRFFNVDTNFYCDNIHAIERKNEERSHTFEHPVETNPQVVYEKTYDGFSDTGLWTKVGDGFMGFAVDTPDAKGVEVD